MRDLLKEIYLSRWFFIYLIFLMLGLYYFLSSELALDIWLYNTNFFYLYFKLVFVVFIARRINLYKSTKYLTMIRLGDDGYSFFLIKSFIYNLLLRLIMIYGAFVPFVFNITSISRLGLYFLISLIVEIINEIIVMIVIYKGYSTRYVSIIFINYVITYFFVIITIFDSWRF